jgi:putative ABC transport system permease protein
LVGSFLLRASFSHEQRDSLGSGQSSLGSQHCSLQENFTNLVSTIRKELADIDPNLPLSDTKPLRETIRERVAPRRIITWLLGIFGLQALLMATVGLYAVLSFTVAERTHEIGIRVALGAQVRDVYALVVRL